MSTRHRDEDFPAVSRREAQAHARNERHRVNAELHDLAGKYADDVDDIDEPGVNYKLPHHHHRAEQATSRRGADQRFWKQRFWKRRSSDRRAREERRRELED